MKTLGVFARSAFSSNKHIAVLHQIASWDRASIYLLWTQGALGCKAFSPKYAEFGQLVQM